MNMYQIAIYIRLSKEDFKYRGESNSITMQRILIQKFAKENFSNYKLIEFCDKKTSYLIQLAEKNIWKIIEIRASGTLYV